MELAEQIRKDIATHPIILYMKGTKERPLCGFSHAVVEVLNHYGVDYKDVNVLLDPEIRIQLAEYSSWPTIPQLFVNGELVGGADIVRELHFRGELLPVLEKAVLRTA
ncbi:MAG: Grx4 family monothiol glutaredoxin [Fidelibacterota bacterium]|nr:MAG: Grx4 family monothiol glutaredoxin [Candidatus Neomarinimicrobiota bacterium]